MGESIVGRPWCTSKIVVRLVRGRPYADEGPDERLAARIARPLTPSPRRQVLPQHLAVLGVVLGRVHQAISQRIGLSLDIGQDQSRYMACIEASISSTLNWVS